MSANSRITVIDIQHRSFKRALQGYDRTDVDKFLDEIIESLEDEATARAALEAEIADLKERISHFKAMEESLQSTLLLAQRTADEVKAAAHKEADLIKQEARLQSEREIGSLGEKLENSRREYQRMLDIAEKAKMEIRGLVSSYLALIDRAPYDAAAEPTPAVPLPAAAPTPAAAPAAAAPAAVAPPATAPAAVAPAATIAATPAQLTTHVTVEPSQADDLPPVARSRANSKRLEV